MMFYESIINHFFVSPGWEVRSLFAALLPLSVFVTVKTITRIGAAIKAINEVPETHPYRPVTEAWQALFAVVLMTVALMMLAILLLQIGVNNPVMWAIVDCAALISLLMPGHVYSIYERCRRADRLCRGNHD